MMVWGRTLSKPAIFLFSAKNSAGLFCCKTSAFFDIAVLLTKHGVLASCHIQYGTVSQKLQALLKNCN